MRTRFLGTDFFFSKSKDQTLEGSFFTPLCLPAPDLFDPVSERDFGNRSFVACDEIRLESDFCVISISKSLSCLFSDLIPQFRQVEAVDQHAFSDKELADFLYGESKDDKFRANTYQLEMPDFEKKLHFEIPELDIPQTETVRFGKEEDCLELCCEVPKIKVPLDIIELDVEVTIPYQEGLVESVYKVERVLADFDNDNTYLKNGTSYVDNMTLNYIPKVPQFELKDVEWDEERGKPISRPETFNSLLSVMELCSTDQEQELALNLKELLPSPNLDILSNISKEPEFEHCDEPRVLPFNSILETDLICLNDKILVDKRSAVYLLNPDGTHSDFPCSVLLQKVEMMDFISDNNSQIFSNLHPTELDVSEVLLKDDADQAKKFYESLVVSELVLVDETFKSLPTPVISDDKSNKPPSAFVQELLCTMEPHLCSASDGIYLDWHLLIQGMCEREVCSRYKTMVDNVYAITLTAEQEIFFSEGAIVDMIKLLEGSQEKMSMQHCKVVTDPNFGISEAENSHECPREAPLTKEEKSQVEKEENNGNKSKEVTSVTSSGKVSMLFESMSQNSDLSFFLGARRGLAKESTFDDDSKKENRTSTVKISTSKESTKPAVMLIEPKQQFTVPMEATKPETFEEPPMMVKHLFQDPKSISSQKAAIYMQDFLPTKEKSISTSFEPASANPALNQPSLGSFRTPGPTKYCVPGVVVVVNTQYLNKPMLVSRRSSYQKILALEKKGAHVVERDINLPLDLVFSAGVCLVWYETGAFGNISTNITDGASCIQMFIENIATNVLISLSYSFSSCIMIFEGEANLLAAVMNHSDTLYSAAVNLDINLQLLCSYSPESTDDIILKCINKFAVPTQGLYPPMPESETLAESFLTKFPSINPLSAHAILSTGGALIDFLEWSNERRIQAVGKYLVPDESIALFSALCRFGEMGESKSVMTDCSSVDSDINSSLLLSPRKRKRFANENVNVPVDCTLFSKPFEQFQDELMELNHVDNQPKKSLNSIIDQFVGRKKRIISCVPPTCDEVETGQAQFLDLAFNEKITHSRNVFGQEPAFMSEILSFPPRSELRNKFPVNRSLPAKRPEFDSYSFRTFPTSAEIEDEITSNWDSQKMKCMKDGTGLFGVQRSVLQADNEETKHPGTSSKQCPGWQFEYLGGGGGQKRSSSSSNSSSKESHCKIRSPSIIDSDRYQGSKEAAKRINKHRGGSKDAVDPLRQKWKDFKLQQTPIPTVDKRKTSAPLNPSWTPVDKRARQNLLFTRNGKEKQSKLVWRRKDSPCISTSLGKRPREEGHIHNI